MMAEVSGIEREPSLEPVMRSGALPNVLIDFRESGARKGAVGCVGGLRKWWTRWYGIWSSSSSQRMRCDCEF